MCITNCGELGMASGASPVNRGPLAQRLDLDLFQRLCYESYRLSRAANLQRSAPKIRCEHMSHGGCHRDGLGRRRIEIVCLAASVLQDNST